MKLFARFKALFQKPENWCFGLILAVYLLTRLWAIDQFPIYFFSDEAIQPVLAADLASRAFFDAQAHFLPTFFQNVDKYSLGTTVYLHVLPTLLLGKSVIVARGVSALVSLLAVLAVSLMLKNVFQRRDWWLAGLLLSITPAWFLHSRTTFETVSFVSFYALFLYFYLRYRQGFSSQLYPALVCGALAFYAYNPGQVVIVVTGLGLLLSDLRWHWEQRPTTLRGLGLLALLSLPFVRYLLTYPGENLQHLATLNSYWTQTLPLAEKLRLYALNYLSGLNPLYWYLPNTLDLARHLMKGYGHILIISAPLALIGFVWMLRRLASPSARILLIAWLAAPTGAALVGPGVTRLLVMVIPLALFTALGLSLSLETLENRFPHLRQIPTTLSLALLLAFNLAMTVDALRNGPTWFQDYGLYGMQYGGQQVFSTVRELQRTDPELIVIVSPRWANNVPVLGEFFLPNLYTTYFVPVDSYLSAYWPIDPDSLFVLLPDELQRAQASQKFKTVEIQQVLNYPNGQPGFYFVRLEYLENIQEILPQP